VTEAVVESTDAARERHATNLELFLDLVFVFAITQIASLIANEPTGNGVAKGLLIACLVWWQWSQFTWAGSAIDLQGNALTRVLVLSIIPFALMMTVSIPRAFGRNGMWFAATYMGVQLLVLAVQGNVAVRQAATRPAFVRYASFAVVAPVLVLIGGFAHGNARIVIWVIAAIVNAVGGLLGAGAGEWAIDPVHFAERHALFIIISLGEVLVSVGATATGKNLTAARATAMLVAVAGACVLWWTYFAFIPRVAEHALRQATGATRGALARDLFTFGHFPLVFGLVLYALVSKHIVLHPLGKLGAHDRWMLAASAVSFIGGLSLIQLRVRRRVAPERIAAMIMICLICWGGRYARSLILVSLVIVIYAVMQAITWHRVTKNNVIPVAP
jgi:low temperature requirement protein LtrA